MVVACPYHRAEGNGDITERQSGVEDGEFHQTLLPDAGNSYGGCPGGEQGVAHGFHEGAVGVAVK